MALKRYALLREQEADAVDFTEAAERNRQAGARHDVLPKFPWSRFKPAPADRVREIGADEWLKIITAGRG